VSRNAPTCGWNWRWCGGLFGLLWLHCAAAQLPANLPAVLQEEEAPRARVIIVRDPLATDAFRAQPERVAAMVNSGLTNLTGRSSVAEAWLRLVSTQDTVGIKVCSAPGPDSGTRHAVVAAIVVGLLEAKIPARQIVVWDRSQTDLRLAGFFDLAERHGIMVQGCDAAGFDETTFYLPDRRIIGQLVAGDLEFGRQGESVGLKSFISKLVTRRLTKIINVAPLLNHNRAGVSGTLYNLAMGSIDNRLRFEADPERLAEAVPEIYMRPALGDRVVLNIMDALVCQYLGEKEPKLHYAAALNEIWLSRDPVALDILALQALDQQRKAAGMTMISTNFMELYQNAAILDLGVVDPRRILVERVH
jgi:hypothetical protein